MGCEFARDQTAIESSRRQVHDHAFDKTWYPVRHLNKLAHPERRMRKGNFVESGDDFGRPRAMDEVFHIAVTQAATEKLLQRRSDQPHAQARRIVVLFDAEDEQMR